jgi:mannose-6-phosphate isomerase-like protein (cupin superfamily)
MIKPFLLFFSCAVLVAAAAPAKVDVYTNTELHSMANKMAGKGSAFGSENLAKYANHRTMLAVRNATGSAEVHEHEADMFYVVTGDATLVTGGTVVNPKTVGAGEIRGSSIKGGERHQLSAGDIVHIPARVPHRLLIDGSRPFAYFVLKVAGQ